VLTYMKERESTQLIEYLGRRLDHAAFFVYEQCQPGDGFGRFMITHFAKVTSSD
jgi:hypothetical protein